MSDFGMFESISMDKSAQDVANRTSLAVARKRVGDQFGHFLHHASTRDEFDTRLELAESDIRRAIHAACDEYGGEHDKIYQIVVSEFVPFEKGQNSHDKKEKGEEKDDEDESDEDEKKESSVKESRRPKLCPYHSEVMDVSLAAGDPQAGYTAMAQHAWGPQHCQGEFDGSCNFKREMVTQSYWDKQSEQAEERAQQREQERQQQPVAPPEVEEELFSEEPIAEGEPTLDDALSEAPSAVAEVETSEPAMALAALSKLVNPNLQHTAAPYSEQDMANATGQPPVGQLPSQDLQNWPVVGNPETGMLMNPADYAQLHADNQQSQQGDTDRRQGLSDLRQQQQSFDSLQQKFPSAMDGINRPTVLNPNTWQASRQAAGADPPAGAGATLKRENISPGGKPGPGNDGLGKPNPKMDKRKWNTENIRPGEPSWSDNPNGPHATERQDIKDFAKYEDDPFVNKPPEHALSPVAERQDINKEITTEKTPTKTWSGTEGQASPVTSNTNPLTNLLQSEYNGFVPSETVQSAISSFEQ